MNARDIIGQFGTQTEVARLCGVTQGAVGNWCSDGKIPPRHWPTLIFAARERGVSLDWDDLVAMAKEPA